MCCWLIWYKFTAVLVLVLKIHLLFLCFEHCVGRLLLLREIWLVGERKQNETTADYPVVTILRWINTAAKHMHLTRIVCASHFLRYCYLENWRCTSLSHRPHPLTWKRMWWLLSPSLVVPNQQSWFLNKRMITSLWHYGISLACSKSRLLPRHNQESIHW